jgi:hypothetical protein
VRGERERAGVGGVEEIFREHINVESVTHVCLHVPRDAKFGNTLTGVFEGFHRRLAFS